MMSNAYFPDDIDNSSKPTAKPEVIRDEDGPKPMSQNDAVMEAVFDNECAKAPENFKQERSVEPPSKFKQRLAATTSATTERLIDTDSPGSSGRGHVRISIRPTP